MTNGERLVQEWIVKDSEDSDEILAQRIDALVAQRVAEEREACARVAQTCLRKKNIKEQIAAAIRRRGEER